MFTPPNNILPLPVILILLIGLSINGCGDSEDEEEVDPLLVTIIDRRSDGPPVPDRSDAEILADRILRRETDDFYFDIPQRRQLINEIEGVLSLIRAAYPSMNAIDAEEDVIPGMLAIYPEPDFYEMLKEMLQDKQGQIRFETGYAEFDALNAKLGVREVRLGGDISKYLNFYFDPRLNLRVASEAYSMVKGVRQVSDYSGYGLVMSTDIKAFKQGETWYVIFWHGWGDCPAGCIYGETICFTVRGTDVESIPTAQAQTMPSFQELDAATSGRWSLSNRTPFGNATAHRWSWWDNTRSWSYGVPNGDSNNLGCSLFGEIEAFPNQLGVSCGYRVESLDWSLDDYDFAGVVLLLIATQERTVIGGDDAPFVEVLGPGIVFRTSSAVVSEPVRVAKTASEIQNPENVYFENVLMAINPPPLSSPFERWWGGVHPTFVVCWDDPETDWRAYQVLTPTIMSADADEASNHPGCDKLRDTDYIQTLVEGIEGPLARENWRDWVDEVLPRP